MTEEQQEDLNLDINGEFDEFDQVSSKKGGKGKYIIILLILLLAGGGAGGYFMMAKGSANTIAASGKKAEKPGKRKALYYSLGEEFTVNLLASGGKEHYLRVKVTVMTRDQAFFDSLKEHEPLIKNDLLTVLSNQSFDELKTVEGKQKLRDDALQMVRNSLGKENGKQHIERLLFTKFIME